MERKEIEWLLRGAEEVAQEEAGRIKAVWPLLKREMKNPQTWRAFGSDLRDFFKQDATDAMLWLLVTLEAEHLQLLFEEYLADMRERGLKATTINRRLASLRRLLRVAHRNGLRREDASHLASLAPVSRDRKDAATAVPSSGDIEQVLGKPNKSTAVGWRDWLILLLIIRLSLSRAQICELSIGDFDPEAGTLAVLPLYKPRYLGARMHRAHQFLTSPNPAPVEAAALSKEMRGEAARKRVLPVEVARALEEYLSHLAESGLDVDAEAPMFRTLDRRHVKDASKNQRLTDDGVYAIVRRYARQAGQDSVNSRALQRAAQAHDAAEAAESAPSSSSPSSATES